MGFTGISVEREIQMYKISEWRLATETSKVVLFFCHIAHQARLAYKKDCLYTLKYCT